MKLDDKSCSELLELTGNDYHGVDLPAHKFDMLTGYLKGHRKSQTIMQSMTESEKVALEKESKNFQKLVDSEAGE